MPKTNGQNKSPVLNAPISEEHLHAMRAKLNATQQMNKVIRPLLEGMTELLRYEENAMTELIEKLEGLEEKSPEIEREKD